MILHGSLADFRELADCCSASDWCLLDLRPNLAVDVAQEAPEYLSKIGSRGNLLLFVFGRIVACQASSRSPPTAAVVPKASATKR
jgi:hypothetical protein